MTPETQAAAEQLRRFLHQADNDGMYDHTPVLDIVGYPLTFGQLRTLLAALAPADTHHCQMCGERCYWQHCPTGGWWAHETPSGGDHDAIPGQPCQPGEDDHCEPPHADRHQPLTDQPCGVIPTERGRQAVIDYRAIRRQQNPRGANQ